MMAPVFLAMGRSTILRFDEKPKTSVIGNQNYFNIEYIGNDLTIQPQGMVSTNLFVYTEFQTYGLILKFGSESHYDDLVTVRWKPGYVNVAATPKKKELTRELKIDRKLEFKGRLRLTARKLIDADAQGVRILELELENLSKTERLTATDLKVLVVGRDGKEIPGQRAVLKLDALAPGQKTEGRLLFRHGQVDPMTLLVTTRDQSGKLLIPTQRRR